LRINQLKKRLEKVRSQRQEGRKGRQRADIPTVALVGYTNAGKSTLFKRLTEADVYIADQLFATLDATLRRVEMPQGGAMVLADTVGFIADLPHELVAAFRSTLEETREASLLLHVIDAQAEGRDERIAEVENVLAQIGADDVPQLQVYNKIDLAGLMPRIDYDDEGRPRRVWISAEKGLGIGLLFQAIEACLAAEIVRLDSTLRPPRPGCAPACMPRAPSHPNAWTRKGAGILVCACHRCAGISCWPMSRRSGRRLIAGFPCPRTCQTHKIPGFMIRMALERTAYGVE